MAVHQWSWGTPILKWIASQRQSAEDWEGAGRGAWFFGCLWHSEIASRASAVTSRASHEARNAKISTFTSWKDLLDYCHYIWPALVGEVRKFKSVGNAHYLNFCINSDTLTYVNLVERILPTLSPGETSNLQLCCPHSPDLLTLSSLQSQTAACRKMITPALVTSPLSCNFSSSEDLLTVPLWEEMDAIGGIYPWAN